MHVVVARSAEEPAKIESPLQTARVPCESTVKQMIVLATNWQVYRGRNTTEAVDKMNREERSARSRFPGEKNVVTVSRRRRFNRVFVVVSQGSTGLREGTRRRDVLSMPTRPREAYVAWRNKTLKVSILRRPVQFHSNRESKQRLKDPPSYAGDAAES